VLGWFADDSGVIVPAVALPMALPLGIAVLAAAAYPPHPPLVSAQDGACAAPAVPDSRRAVPAPDLAAGDDRRGEHPGVGRRGSGR